MGNLLRRSIGFIGILLTVFLLPVFATAQEGALDARTLPCWWWLVPVFAVLGLVAAYMCYRSVMVAPEGNDRMKEIAGYVREGAYAYLRRQYSVVAIVVVVLCGLLAFMAFVLHVQHPLVPFAFITGAFFSGLAGFIGMKTATS
ncbi:MAG: hypothetical protein GX589_10705, partial [Deltaproteobacteria bacterium]|nr:hypothetical protein [Deltaproteobacteria bacterium]